MIYVLYTNRRMHFTSVNAQFFDICLIFENRFVYRSKPFPSSLAY